MRAREMRRSGAEFDGTGFRIHRLHDCQGINVVSRCAQLIAAALETLLHRDADALDRRSGIMAQIDQALQSLAVGQEVIKQQHMVALVEIPLGHDDGEFLLLGEGVDGGGVLVAIEIDGLRLLGEHHRRIAEMTRGNTGDTNAGSSFTKMVGP